MSNVSIISCCESTGKHVGSYDQLAVRLAYSIRKNGGSYADAPIHMWYAEDRPPAPKYAQMLKDFGCTLVPGPCLIPEHRVYNKVTAVATPVETEYAMWVDSDVFVLQDMAGLIDGNPGVSASPTTYAFHKWAAFEDKPHWDKYYQAIGMENPDLELATDIDDAPGIFYLCSGVFLFKTGVNFPKLYKDCAATVLGTDVPKCEQNFSQTSLTLAAVKSGLAFKKLPERYQLFYSLRRTIFPDTVMVHYQDCRVEEISDHDWSAAGLL